MGAYRAVQHPVVIDSSHWINCAIVTSIIFAAIAIFHRTIAVRFKRQYFTIHVAVNAVITYLTFAGSVRALLNPTVSTVPTADNASSQFFICWCFALHVYHPCFFSTGAMDWIHHTPVYILNFLMYGCLFSDTFHLQALIMTGLPGGIDYLLLVLEGEGVIKRAVYKQWSAYINNWCRAPVGFVSGYICLLGLYHQHGRVQTTSFQCVVFVLMGVHAMWNPPFFGRQTIEANIVDIINRFDMHGNSADKKQGISLTKVRAKSGRSKFGDLVVEGAKSAGSAAAGARVAQTEATSKPKAH